MNHGILSININQDIMIRSSAMKSVVRWILDRTAYSFLTCVLFIVVAVLRTGKESGSDQKRSLENQWKAFQYAQRGTAEDHWRWAGVLQWVAVCVCCTVLYCVAVHVCCSVSISTCINIRSRTSLMKSGCVAVWCSVLQCVAAYHSVLQCITVCCSVRAAAAQV